MSQYRQEKPSTRRKEAKINIGSNVMRYQKNKSKGSEANIFNISWNAPIAALRNRRWKSRAYANGDLSEYY